MVYAWPKTSAASLRSALPWKDRRRLSVDEVFPAVAQRTCEKRRYDHRECLRLLLPAPGEAATTSSPPPDIPTTQHPILSSKAVLTRVGATTKSSASSARSETGSTPVKSWEQYKRYVCSESHDDPCGDGSTSPFSGAFNDHKSRRRASVPIFAFPSYRSSWISRSGRRRRRHRPLRYAQLADYLRPDGTQALIRTPMPLGNSNTTPPQNWTSTPTSVESTAWRTGYQGYNSIAIVKTPSIPATTTSTAIPGTTTTTIKVNQYGGYGSPFANNSGCSTETAPRTSSLPPAAAPVLETLASSWKVPLGSGTD